MNDWNYISTEHEIQGGSFQPFDKTIHIFKNNYANIEIDIVEMVYYKPRSKGTVIDKRTKGINIIAESSDSYKFLLKDLYRNNFKIIGKEEEWGKIDIATSTPQEMTAKMKKDYVNTRTASKKYSNGSDQIQVIIDDYEKLTKNYETLRRTKYMFIL
jgi:hypothetical protein